MCIQVYESHTHGGNYHRCWLRGEVFNLFELETSVYGYIKKHVQILDARLGQCCILKGKYSHILFHASLQVRG